MEDYVVQLLATTKEKFRSGFIGCRTGFWITGLVLFIYLFYINIFLSTIYFPCLLLLTWNTNIEEGATAPSLKRENPLQRLLGGSCATGHRKVESLKSTQIKQSQSNIVQRAAWWLCLCSRVQNQEEGQSWKQRSMQSQKNHIRSGVKKFSWQEILGNCTLIVCIKRHSIPWGIELKFIFDLEKQVVIPFHLTIASSFWATTTLASSKNVTSKYPCINKMTNWRIRAYVVACNPWFLYDMGNNKCILQWPFVGHVSL